MLGFSKIAAAVAMTATLASAASPAMAKRSAAKRDATIDASSEVAGIVGLAVDVVCGTQYDCLEHFNQTTLSEILNTHDLSIRKVWETVESVVCNTGKCIIPSDIQQTIGDNTKRDLHKKRDLISDLTGSTSNLTGAASGLSGTSDPLVSLLNQVVTLVDHVVCGNDYDCKSPLDALDINGYPQVSIRAAWELVDYTVCDTLTSKCSVPALSSLTSAL